MNVKIFPLGVLRANCYVISNDKHNAVAVDIGGDSPTLLKRLHDDELTLTKIILTHGHYDHIGGVFDVQQKTNAQVFIHQNDADMLTNKDKNLFATVGGLSFNPVENYDTFSDKDVISQDDLNFKVIHTPGHTQGSVCFLCGDSLFSGDTLFKMSIGRTDLPGGSMDDMLNSLQKINSISDNVTIYPGHGDYTNLDFEKKNNMYLKGNLYDDFI